VERERGKPMRLSRRGMLLGGMGAALASCAPAQRLVEMSDPLAPVAVQPEPLVLSTEPLRAPTLLDPEGLIRRDLRERAVAALDAHAAALGPRDRIYVVDFARHSAEPRLFELDLESGRATAFRTAHGVGSDPAHVGVPQAFSNIPDSLASSVGAYRTGGAGWGSKHGPNVLLDGLDPTNDAARARAIIVHAADYCEPEFVAREGKLGRSFGCFATSFADLPFLRERMGEGRLLYASA